MPPRKLKIWNQEIASDQLSSIFFHNSKLCSTRLSFVSFVHSPMEFSAVITAEGFRGMCKWCRYSKEKWVWRNIFSFLGRTSGISSSRWSSYSRDTQWTSKASWIEMTALTHPIYSLSWVRWTAPELDKALCTSLELSLKTTLCWEEVRPIPFYDAMSPTK